MKLLVAEDDKETAQLMAARLVELGHQVAVVHDGQAALSAALEAPPDVMILDRMLPKLDGVEVMKSLRKSGLTTPVLMLTALGRVEDRVDGLDAGADDYLVKPFAVAELNARVNALARRAASGAPTTRLQVRGVVLDLIARSVVRDGRPVVLQPREFRLLEELARNAGKIMTRSMLLERVWDFHFDPKTSIVETHVSRMRSKLNEGFAEDLIETVRGEGYRMRADA